MIASLNWLAWNLGLMGGAVLVALLVHYLLFALLRRSAHSLYDLFYEHCYEPTRWFAVAITVWLVRPLTSLPASVTQVIDHALSIFWILIFSWLFLRLCGAGHKLLLRRFHVADADTPRARRINTQLRIFSRVLTAAVVVVAVGCVLMTFTEVRQLGLSLLASAGVAGIVVGFAAQRALASLMAGLQLAITQPIQLGDLVVVENESGTVEEIALTYVVVRTWDLRRLVVPVSYFIDKPFQNWTRVSADLLGTAYLYADFTVPVEAVRRELEKVVQASNYWDRKKWSLQVTNISNQGVELRATLSAADSSALWNLCCEVREQLLDFLQTHCPTCLPKVRIQTASDATQRVESPMSQPSKGQ